MIKVGIIGADKPDSGELLRILVNHPEVDVVSLFAPGMTGRQVTSCHAGFIGERAMTFSDKIDPSKLDVVFIADDSQVGKDLGLLICRHLVLTVRFLQNSHMGCRKLTEKGL